MQNRVMRMTDQEKREKVIKGLEACLEGLSEICPYKDSDAPGGCKDELMYDALTLLKAQEPRVMTPEEVIALPDYTVVWLEDNDKSDVISGIVNYVWKNHLCSFTVIDMREVHADIASYGTDWRCWTACPTHDQMKAAKWEE